MYLQIGGPLDLEKHSRDIHFPLNISEERLPLNNNTDLFQFVEECPSNIQLSNNIIILMTQVHI